jgi:penicillin-binding protein 1C
MSPRPLIHRTKAAPSGGLRVLGRWLLLALAPLLLLLGLDHLFPPPLPEAGTGGASLVVARDGRPLRAFADAHGVWRHPVELGDVSPRYLEALITYEDRRFRWHAGVDPIALLRASGQALWHGRIVSGGSTLTMQVARIIDPQPRSLAGKLRQALRALQLEWRLSKDEILTLYVNHAPFGGPIEGVEAASRAYLGKPSARLSHAEAALLAVLPQAPSRLRPDRHPERARAARDKVLQRLADQGRWPEERLREAADEPVVARRLEAPMLAPLLAERLRAAEPRNSLIESTLDADLQAQVEAQVEAWVQRLPPRTSAAVLVVSNESLEVLAYIGSARFGEAESSGHIDMVRAFRSPGSTLKPFLYGMALEHGLIHSESLLVDAPQDFDGYRPGNFDQRFRGPVSASEALQASLNVPAVALLQAVGPERFAARLAHAGLPLRLPRGAQPNLAMILGGTEVRLEDLVAAFAALMRGGEASTLRLRSNDGSEARRLLSPGAAWIVRDMLAGTPRPGEAGGRFDRSQRAALAYKTGTSYGFRDAWAVGGTAGATLGVWVGRPDGTPLPGQYGAITALPLLLALVDGLPSALRRGDLPRPDSVEAHGVCWPLGLAAEETPAALCQRSREAWVLDRTLPPTLLPVGDTRPLRLAYRVDAAGRRLSPGCRPDEAGELRELARWPVLLEPWLAPAERRASRPPPLAPGCTEHLELLPALRIEGVLEGSVLAPAPPRNEPPNPRLRAIGSTQRVHWLLNGELVGETQGASWISLRLERAGNHRLVALDAQGRYAELGVRVMPGGRE